MQCIVRGSAGKIEGPYPSVKGAIAVNIKDCQCRLYLLSCRGILPSRKPFVDDVVHL